MVVPGFVVVSPGLVVVVVPGMGRLKTVPGRVVVVPVGGLVVVVSVVRPGNVVKGGRTRRVGAPVPPITWMLPPEMPSAVALLLIFVSTHWMVA
ncbi:MAG: hypothetical protein ACE5JM_14065, partial [Armatimonadota bacterium]